MAFLTDGSDLVGVYRAQDVKYMKIFRFFLVIMGAWPGKLLGEGEKYRILFRGTCFFLFSINLVSGIFFVKNNVKKLSYFEMCQTYITVLMTWISATRYISVFLDKTDKLMIALIKEIHLINHKTETEQGVKVHLFIHRLSYFFTIYSIVMVFWVAIFFNVTPILNNISNGGFDNPRPSNFTFEHSVYYELPFDYQHDINGYVVVFIYNWYVSFLCAMSFVFYDLIIAMLVFHLWGHLKILIHDLEYIQRPGFKGQGSSATVTDKHYTDEEIVDLSKRLKRIVNHHRFILRHCDEISNIVGFDVANYYMFHQISGCLLLLECSEMNPKALIRFGPLTLSLTGLLIQVSVIFELLSSMTDPLIRAVYNVPWECMDKKNRKIVLMMLRQTQIPLGLKALGLVEVGVKTSAAILKTTLSYFMMLRTL